MVRTYCIDKVIANKANSSTFEQTVVIIHVRTYMHMVSHIIVPVPLWTTITTYEITLRAKFSLE